MSAISRANGCNLFCVSRRRVARVSNSVRQIRQELFRVRIETISGLFFDKPWTISISRWENWRIFHFIRWSLWFFKIICSCTGARCFTVLAKSDKPGIRYQILVRTIVVLSNGNATLGSYFFPLTRLECYPTFISLLMPNIKNNLLYAFL